MSASARAVLVFAKAPRPGHAKTRLIPLLGAAWAARLQARLCEHTLGQLAQGPWAVQLWCTPDCGQVFFQRCERRYGVSLYRQQGDGLGARMSRALGQALQRYRQVVIVGTDCPGLSADYVARAFQVLDDGRQAVIGPAEDGGYVLLGLRRFEPGLFNGIAWGGATVYRETLARLQGLGWSWQVLETLWDVDRPADYLRLVTAQALPSA